MCEGHVTPHLHEQLHPAPPSGHLVSVADVAAMTGLSDTAVYRAIAAGELRAAKLRGRLRIRVADVDSWIDSSAVRPVSAERESRPSRSRGVGVGVGAAASLARGNGRGLRELLHARA
jgi:excisionase family DNA binding protein